MYLYVYVSSYSTLTDWEDEEEEEDGAWFGSHIDIATWSMSCLARDKP